METPTAFDPIAFKRALAKFGTGVTIITTRGKDDAFMGFTASSFNSVSLDPPMVLWSQAKSAPSFPHFRDAELFAVNVLAGHQAELAHRFARPHHDKFAGVAYEVSPEGLPVLHEAAAVFICRNEHLAYGGDHMIFITSVLRCLPWRDTSPLFFWNGQLLAPTV